MPDSINEALADISSDLQHHKCDTIMVTKIRHKVNGARQDLQRFIDERELSPDAVEEIEEVIKCLE